MAPTTNTALKESASVAAASAGSAAVPPADRRIGARDALVDEDAWHHRDGARERDAPRTAAACDRRPCRR